MILYFGYRLRRNASFTHWRSPRCSRKTLVTTSWRRPTRPALLAASRHCPSRLEQRSTWSRHVSWSRPTARWRQSQLDTVRRSSLDCSATPGSGRANHARLRSSSLETLDQRSVCCVFLRDAFWFFCCNLQ